MNIKYCCNISLKYYDIHANNITKPYVILTCIYVVIFVKSVKYKHFTFILSFCRRTPGDDRFPSKRVAFKNKIGLIVVLDEIICIYVDVYAFLSIVCITVFIA